MTTKRKAERDLAAFIAKIIVPLVALRDAARKPRSRAKPAAPRAVKRSKNVRGARDGD